MCGIFGYINYNKGELEKARQALHSLTHRGPDQWKDFSDQKVYMGHQRLSIIDLSEQGAQPMISDDKSIIITVNGEIYNFKKIREELGFHLFKGQSDSEVILHGYQQWGLEKLISKIDGMYAISIYDRNLKKVFLVRDRVGIKPLYYCSLNSNWMWASELKAIVSFHNTNLSIDNTALYDFMTYQYIPTPKTLYQQCFKLEPAHYAEIDIDSQSFIKKRYWSLIIDDCIKDKSFAKITLRDKIIQSVAEQMVADVPVGFFLSGGVDSSTVVAASSFVTNKMETFSIGFNDKKQDETPFAQQVAKKFKTNHHQKIVDGETIRGLFSKLGEWYDEPFADLSCFPSFMVSAHAREKVTVAHTGDGGDELFGGYKWYSRFSFIKKFNLNHFLFLKPYFKFLTSKSGIRVLNKYIPLFFLDDLELFTKLKGGLIHEEKKKYRAILNIPNDYDDYWYFRKFYKMELPVYTRLQVLDFYTYLPDDILTKVDRVSMAVALECRVPLLSTDLVEFAFSLSEKVRFQQYGKKGILKAAFDDLIPKNILNRGKRGFGIPSGMWKSEVLGKSKNRFEKILEEIFKIEISQNGKV